LHRGQLGKQLFVRNAWRLIVHAAHCKADHHHQQHGCRKHPTPRHHVARPLFQTAVNATTLRGQEFVRHLGLGDDSATLGREPLRFTAAPRAFVQMPVCVLQTVEPMLKVGFCPVFHFLPSRKYRSCSSSRSFSVARNKCAFTVPTSSPRISAISARG